MGKNKYINESVIEESVNNAINEIFGIGNKNGRQRTNDERTEDFGAENEYKRLLIDVDEKIRYIINVATNMSKTHSDDEMQFGSNMNTNNIVPVPVNEARLNSAAGFDRNELRALKSAIDKILAGGATKDTTKTIYDFTQKHANYNGGGQSTGGSGSNSWRQENYAYEIQDLLKEIQSIYISIYKNMEERSKNKNLRLFNGRSMIISLRECYDKYLVQAWNTFKTGAWGMFLQRMNELRISNRKLYDIVVQNI